MLFAARHWPDAFDLFVLALIGGTIVGILVAGHALMFIDFRRYLRSLRRTIIVVANYLPHIPAWARQETPRCLVALGLLVQTYYTGSNKTALNFTPIRVFSISGQTRWCSSVATHFTLCSSV